MSKDECLQLIENSKYYYRKESAIHKLIPSTFLSALALAMARDDSSDGVIRTGVITEKGIERKGILDNELPRFYEG